LLQLAEVHPQADDGPESIEVGASIDSTFQDFHRPCLISIKMG
jgi:hypothetical protein